MKSVRKRKSITLARLQDSGPTPERIVKSAGDYDIGSDETRGKVYTFRDDPISRLMSKGQLSDQRAQSDDERKKSSEPRYQALLKYRHHWHHAGMEPTYGNFDLNKVFAQDGAWPGMPATEYQAFHREQYRGAVKKLGMKASFTVEKVVCEGDSLEAAGIKLGYRNGSQARTASIEILQIAADILVNHWGIIPQRIK